MKNLSPLLLFFSFLLLHHSQAAFLADPAQPLNPADYPSPNTVPAFPAQQQTQTCNLDLSAELFGGVKEACGGTLDRSRCCPVLAAWLFAAHARTALEITPAPSPSPAMNDLPMIPDDSQKCVDSLQSSLQSRNIEMTRPNATCDTTLCFCRIRLHQITSLSCPAAFNISNGRNATPTAAVRDLEKSCRNSSYIGCTKCLGALEKLTEDQVRNGTGNRTSEMLRRDCRLMGLTWLLARNKTEYIPTVSAVLRAIMYGGHPSYDDSKCSPDRENMPLAVDSLQFETIKSSSSVLWPPAAAVISLHWIIIVYCYLLFLL
ncbi:uncharacterized GPI-anchored protein At4g28100-like [Impatiens glandulifera]|uniref:uncharacterized GPI-anchored protein At4g28100-like n=1 Tax=Impatiens glandulifera TaxID=253017 RepID=UPI001FB19523|nr:uncharacterized GPI-anchored protein At4g28100-like [Impatiens glandulifera]